MCRSKFSLENNIGDIAHNYHNCFPFQEFFLPITVAIAEASTPTLFTISDIMEINLWDLPNSFHFF